MSGDKKLTIGRYWPILVIIILGTIIPLIWFRDGLLIAGGDDIWYLDPSNYFKESLSTWVDKFNLGVPNIQVNFIFPVVSFWVFLKTIGISLVNIERLWMILLFILSGLTLYYLVIRLMGEDEEGRVSSWARVAGFIGALLYMFNMYVVAQYPTIAIRPVQIVLPLILLFWMKGMQEQKFSLKYPLILGLLFIFLFSSETNIASFAIIPLILLIYWIFYIFTHPSKERIIHSLKFSGVVLGIFLIVNFWWLATSFTAGLAISKETGEFIKPAHFINQTHLWEAFRFLGNWSFRIPYGGSNPPIPHIPYSPTYYNNPIIIIFTYLIPFLAFLALIFKPRNKNVLFFGFLTIVGLFLAKGANAPLGGIFKYFFDNVPGFWGFRNPYSRFSLIHLLGISVLLGISIGLIYQKMNHWQIFNRKKIFFLVPKLLPLLVGLIILFISFPLLTGEVIQDESWHGLKRESMHVKVPEYWQEVSQWFKDNDPGARIFLLPKTGYGHCYLWESGTCVGDPVARTLLSNPLVYFPTVIIHSKDELISQLYTAIDTNNKEEILALLRLFSIKYILQQNDVDWTYGLMVKSRSPGQLKSVLEDQESLAYLKSFGKLDLYRVKDDYFVPAIYAPYEITYVDGASKTLVDLVKGEKEKVDILASSLMNDTQRKFISTNLDKVDNVLVEAEPIFSTGKIEYKFNISQAAQYELFVRKGYAFSGLEYCANCPSKIKVKFKPLISFDEKDKKEIGRIDEEPFQLQSKFEIIEEPLAMEEVKRLDVVDPWYFVQVLDKNADIYESIAPLPFPENYITKPGVNAPFLVFRGDKQLKKEWYVLPDEVDTVKISSNPPLPRRLFTTVPKGTKPTDNYWILYLDHTPSLKEISSEISSFEGYAYLGSLSFSQGKHKLEIPVDDSSLNQDKANDFTLILKLKQKPIEKPPKPSIEFKKIAPYEYKVSVKKATGPFFLIFNESFHPQWQASLIKEGSIDENQHFIINGFLNAWFVEPPQGKENFDILIRYRPQRLYLLGLIVLGVFIVFSLNYLIRKKRYD